MTHKILPHEAQLAIERVRTAGAQVEAMEAKLLLAKVALQTAKDRWERIGVACGLQEKDFVTEDYRIQRNGAFVEAEEPKETP